MVQAWATGVALSGAACLTSGRYVEHFNGVNLAELDSAWFSLRGKRGGTGLVRVLLRGLCGWPLALSLFRRL